MPHRIHVSKVYPLLSPNGSTLIVCGHGQGILILWSGGRPFKHEQPPPASNPINGASKDAVMVIDSEDEESEKPYRDMPNFLPEEGEGGSSKPYDSLIQSLDLPLGIAVLHISFPRLPSEPHESNMRSLPKLVSERLVVAMACSDFTIRVLTVPLVPPSPKRKMKSELRGQPLSGKNVCGQYGEQMIVLSGGNGHQSIPKGVSLTTTRLDPRTYENEMKDVLNPGDSQGHTLVGSGSAFQARSQSSLEGTGSEWNLLVASHSTDFSGLVLIHKIAIIGDGSSLTTKSAQHHLPWQIQYLPSPASTISFNSSVYPAPRHSQLLIAESKGVVRVFDCLSPHDDGSEGSWILSLYSAFQASSDPIPSRKHIMGAEWCLAGKAVIALLVDGEWGVWDVENDGPKARNELKLAEGISGTLLTNFTFRGWTTMSYVSNYRAKNSGTTFDTSRCLVPMTSGTRRIRQENLFSGPAAHQTSFFRGGVSVSPTLKTSVHKADDESILIWHGDNIIIFPSLITYWQNAVRGAGNLFGDEDRGQLKRLSSASLGGGVWNDVSLFPEFCPSGLRSLTADQKDLLITRERKIIIMTPYVADSRRQVSSNQPAAPSSIDQHLLSIGGLDVSGMDRILAGLSNGLHGGYRNRSASVKKVGFRTRS